MRARTDGRTSPTSADLNQSYKRYWAEENPRARRRLEDQALREYALASFEAELQRVPMRYQLSFEAHLANAESTRDRFAAETMKAETKFRINFARKGGLALKTDALGLFIDKALQKKSNLTLAELIGMLKAEHMPGGFICDIDEDALVFDNYGAEKIAKMSGLQHRLSRARKKVKSR